MTTYEQPHQERARIWLHLCTNNPNNGLPTGHVNAVHIERDGDMALELVGPPIRVSDVTGGCNRTRDKLRFGRILVTVSQYRNWVGNWCWSAVLVSTPDAVRMLQYAQGRGWNCEAGYTPWFEKWHHGEAITEADLAAK